MLLPSDLFDSEIIITLLTKLTQLSIFFWLNLSTIIAAHVDKFSHSTVEHIVTMLNGEIEEIIVALELLEKFGGTISPKIITEIQN